MKHFKPNIYKDFELYQVFMYNFLYSVDLNTLTKKIRQIFVPKYFNSPMLYTTDEHFYNSAKNSSISFFSSYDVKIPPSFRMPHY